jgi:hypothetical protein
MLPPSAAIPEAREIATFVLSFNGGNLEVCSLPSLATHNYSICTLQHY